MCLPYISCIAAIMDGCSVQILLCILSYSNLSWGVFKLKAQQDFLDSFLRKEKYNLNRLGGKPALSEVIEF